MCARSAAAISVSMGYGFGSLVASYKEYEDAAVALVRQATPQDTRPRRYPGAGGIPPPRSIRSQENGDKVTVTNWVAQAQQLYANMLETKVLT